MIVKVYEEAYKALQARDKTKAKNTGLGQHVFRHSYGEREFADLNLARRTTPEITWFLEVFARVRDSGARKPYGINTLCNDLKAYLDIQESGGKTGKPRSVQHFTSIAHTLLRNSPGHRLYHRDAEGVELCYYVAEVKYIKPDTRRDYSSPPYCQIKLVYSEFGSEHERTYSLGPDDCLRTHPIAALANDGYYLETPELRERYLSTVKRFDALVGRIGLQLWASGTATDDMDGNPKGRSTSWYWRRTNTIQMVKHGESSRVVIDVFKEDDSEEDNGYGRRRRGRKEVQINRHYWKRDKALTEGVYDHELTQEEADADADHTELPLHPYLCVFDMKRHLRLKINAMSLEDYVYDVDLGESLVLPQEVLDLVEILIAKKGTFKDVVAGKGVGSVILCAGPPGTGKTLTAEVYAEVMERPLYSVQASQLGLGAEELEDELLKSFARAQRWQAILLIDEADVYVKKRGNDLAQNAIVGVFLRVLEYYGGVLFMTTNRANSVDDAIASRCVARIDYAVPSLVDQGRIWRIIADGSEIPLRNDTIAQIVKNHPRLSGRDIKNLLKLAHMVSLAKRSPITCEMVDYVKKFKPTTTTGELSELEEALDAIIDVSTKARGDIGQDL